MKREQMQPAPAFAALSAGIPPAGLPPAAAEGSAPASSREEEKKLIDVVRVSLKDQMDACRRLGVVGTKDAVPALAAHLGDEKLSHMARYGLEPIPDPSVDAALRDALGKVKDRRLVGVIGSLGVRGDAQAAGALAGFLGSSDAHVVGAAARALGRIGTAQAAGALKDRLASAPAAVRADVADGCLGCAERLAARGDSAGATALYEAVAKADLPEHIRLAAKRGAGA